MAKRGSDDTLTTMTSAFPPEQDCLFGIMRKTGHEVAVASLPDFNNVYNILSC